MSAATTALHISSWVQKELVASVLAVFRSFVEKRLEAAKRGFREVHNPGDGEFTLSQGCPLCAPADLISLPW
jgi:hypothetical protein